MKFNHFKQITGLLAVLVASGCASTTRAPQVGNVNDSLAVNSIGAATLGDVINLPAEAGLGSTSIIVTSEYMAASRRLCRRMQTTEGKSLSRVACKSDSGQWILARDLVPDSTHLMSSGALSVQQMPQPEISGAQALILDASSIDASSFEQGESEMDNTFESVEVVTFESGVSDISIQPMGQLATEEFVVLANETLWSFAKRTTGNALNWQRIAEINNIDDARTVSDGDVLKVPSELSKSGS